MAEEVGAAYVSLIPSARNLSAMIKKELQRALRGIKGEGIPVPVTPEVDAVSGALRTQLQTQMKALAKRIALEVPVSADGNALRDKLNKQLAEMRGAVSLAVPTEPGELGDYQRKLRSMLDSTKVTQRVKVETDLDTSSAKAAAIKSGTSVGDLFLRGFGGGLLNPLIGIPALILAAIAAPITGGIVASAVAAGGALALILLGGFGLRADEELKKALGGLKDTANKTLTDAAQPLKGPFLEAIKILGSAIKDMGPTLKSVFKNIGPSIPKLAEGFAGFMKSFRDTGALEKLSQIAGPLLEQLAFALPDIGNAISQFLISVSKPETVDFFGKLLRGLADAIRFTGDTVSFLVHHFNGLMTVLGAVGTFISNVGLGFKTLWDAIVNKNEEARQAIYDAASGIHDMAVKVKQWWNDLWSGAATKVTQTVGAVTSTVKELPGKITSAVGDLGRLLFDAGRNVVTGLIDGIKSKFGDLGSAARGMAQTIRNYLPFSPAKTGPLSGSGNPFHSGQIIAGDVAAGVRSQLPTVSGAASQLAGMFGAGGPAQASGGASTGGLLAQWAPGATGDNLLDALRELISFRYGGSPDRALGGA